MRLRGAIGATLILFFYGVRSPAWGENREVPATIRDVYVVLFVLDGCRADLFDQAIKAGELPTVARELVAKGATYEQALAVFPSVSPSGYQAMVSGLFPGHAGIPYLEWFDRERLRVVPFLSLRGPRNVNSSFRNFYAPEKSVSIFDDLREYPTAAVYSLFSRHAKTRLPRNVLPASIAAFLTHRLEKLDTLALREVRKLFARPTAEIPRFTLVGLVGTDWLTHTLGVWHPRVKANLKQFDEFLKDFLALLKQSGIMEKTYIVVTGDHGAHDIDGLFDLKRYLRSNGLRLIGRLRRRQPDAIYVGARGVGSSIVSVPGEGGWDTDPTIERLRRFPATNGRGVDLIALLLNAPEVMLVAVREDAGHIRLFQRDGEAVITVRNETLPRYGYTVLNNGWDPLGFRDDPSLRSFTDGRLLNAWQWARLTNSSDFPDAVVQLGQVFADRRAGDLVVISAPRWGFYHEKEATHGSIILVDLRVPLLIRGPTIRSGRYDWARLVDLYPTMRHWFGLGETDMPIDGRLLQLR